MDTQPKIPTLKDSQKPQVKIRGLETGMTLFDRLKQFKKKDLAFILAGLGTLFMAPLAEHFMMSPESADGQQLKAGWGQGGGKGMFDGSGSSPYEPGTTGLAPGSAVGGGSDIITPLNVRDPSALVMGPGATQQPPTNSVMPATPPPTAPASHSDSDLKDALAASARGVGAAAHAAKALLPVPKIALAGSGGLRGLGVVSGGTSAVAGGAPSSAGLVSGKAATGGGMAGVTGGNNIKSIARSPTGGGSGADAALKAAGDAAANMFNKGGTTAATSLDNAAAQQIPAGGAAAGGLGAGQTGATDKAFGGDQNKDGKSVGESLAFLKQKAIQEAQIALWSKEQEAGDNKLEALKIRNSMAEAFTSKIAGAAADQAVCSFTGGAGSNCPAGAAGVTNYWCNMPGSSSPQPISASSVGKNSGACMATPAGAGGAGGASAKMYYTTNGGSTLISCTNGTALTCTPDNPSSASGGSSDPPKKNVDDLKSGVAGAGVSGDAVKSPSKDMGTNCNTLKDLKSKVANSKATVDQIDAFIKAAGAVVAVRDAIESTDPTKASGDCDNTSVILSGKNQKSLMEQLRNIAGKADGVLTKTSGTLDKMDALNLIKKPDDDRIKQIGQDVNGDGQDTPGAAKAIDNFVSDEGKVNSAPGAQGLNADVKLDPQPLLDAHYAAKDIKDLTDQINAAVKTVKLGAETTGNSLAHLNSAAQGLAPQAAVLRVAAGKDPKGTDGTVGLLVQRNADFDNIGGAADQAKIPTPTLTKPDASKTSNTGGGDISAANALAKQLADKGDVDSGIQDADKKVQKLNGDLTKDSACASAPCTTDKQPAQDALDKVGPGMSSARSAQLSIDKTVRNAAQTAAGLVNL
ncbi:MAG TPA: hypothetical protein VN915_09015 [Elusimicrobiota bacterium]|nr:hypothetical protein [Elusimicrobiota bacterium]